MTRGKLLSALVASLASAVILYAIDHQRATKATRLRNANDRLRFDAGLRRNEAARPPPPQPASMTVPDSASALPSSSDVPAVRVSTPAVLADYGDEGIATPMAALQTFAWHGDRGDAEALGRMIVFDRSARALSQAYFDALPQEVRRTVGTLERLAAVELTANIIHLPFPRAGMLERARVESGDDKRVVLHLPGSARERMEFQHTPEGWKYVITAAMVEAFLAERTVEAP